MSSRNNRQNWGGGSRGNFSRGGRGSGAPGICYLWQSTGTCRFGSNCKYRHDGPSGKGSSAVVKIKRNKNDLSDFVQHLSQLQPKSLGKTLNSSYSLWCKCWDSHKTLDNRTLRLLIETLAKLPGSLSVDGPPIHSCEEAIDKFVYNESNESKQSKTDDQIETTVETIERAFSRLVQFTWDCDKDQVKMCLSNILLAAEGMLRKKNKQHREASRRLLKSVEDLENPWRIVMKVEPEDHEDNINTCNKPRTFSEWQTATVQWLSNPAFFSPSRLPAFKVPNSSTDGCVYNSTAGVYDSPEDYMNTVHRLWVGMTFSDGFAALAPHCRTRTKNGSSCQSALFPVADVAEVASKLRCRTRDCNGLVEFSCRMKGHDALCGSCASRALANHRGSPGPKASTHIYDGTVESVDSDGRLYIKGFKSRNPPQHNIHWKSSKRLSSPNLVGIIKLTSKGSSLHEHDRILWGEICFHGKPQDEGNRRQRGDLCVNMASICEFDHDSFEEGMAVAIIDCMTFVPEWIPVLHALEKQTQAVLPFENGKYLNLCKDDPADISNSVTHDMPPEEVFVTDVSILIQQMIDQSKIEPIREIRRDSSYYTMLQTKLEKLVTETTLDMMQLISFLDSFRNPVHLTQGPPGTGKSYLGVVIVRALIIIRDLWVRKSKTIGSPPILVLSYKNHAIDEFLVDLVKAEPYGSLANKLIRIGGSCKDQRLARYSERDAFQSDFDVNSCRSKLQILNQIRDSIQVTLESSVVSYLAYKHKLFGDHDGTAEEVNKIRDKASRDATSALMASLVRLGMLSSALEMLDEDKGKTTNDDVNEDDVNSQTPTQFDVGKELSFLLLNPDQSLSKKFEAQVNNFDNQKLVMNLVKGVSHYPNMDHWGDVLHKWISGTVALPLCQFKDNKTGKRCKNLSIEPDIEFCDIHLCHFKGCTLACVSSGSSFCEMHGCEYDGCISFRLPNHLYCKSHCCKRCVELGKEPAAMAADEPPRNVCEDHPMCLNFSCMKYCFGDEMYCEDHIEKNLRCSAITKRGKSCKGTPVSPHILYCRSHLHLAPKVEDIDIDDDETGIEADDPALVRTAKTSSTCQALTKKGKKCKGAPMSGSNYCHDHSYHDTKMRSTATTVSKKFPEAAPPITNPPKATSVADDPPVPLPSVDDSKSAGKDQGDSTSVASSASYHSGNNIVDDTNILNVDFDEMSMEGENLEHMRDVFEVNDGTGSLDDADDDEEDLVVDGDEDTFFDAYSEANNDGSNAWVPADPNSWHWKMNLEDRWDEIQKVMNEQKVLLEKVLRIVKKAVKTARKDLSKAKICAKARVYENRSIIGGTMVGCISRLESIRAVRPFAVVVEEASEVLEPLLFSCLCESTMKLEMIGDHRQLQPSIMSRFEFEILNKINISMFQRLIEAPPGHQVPSSVLSVQRRMRKDICDLTREYYADVVNIDDHDCCATKLIGEKHHESQSMLVRKSSSKGREVPGVAPHIFLWTHSGKQEKARVGLSRINTQEAMMVCGLAAYLVECGVPKQSIAILTPYKGQLLHIRDTLQKDKTFSKSRLVSRDPKDTDVVRLSTVDRFQGDEEDIVLCSLVVDENSKTPFVKLVNRMIVLLSRARLGLYIAGNVGYFQGNGLPKHWASTLNILKQPATNDSSAAITSEDNNHFAGVQTGNEIPLCCPLHRQVINEVANPASLKLGFCQQICTEILPCQHPCSLVCHFPALQHNKKCSIELDSPCQRHSEKITCDFASKNSDVALGSDFNSHLQQYKCPRILNVDLVCGHEIQLQCWEETEISNMQRPWPTCFKPSPMPFVYPTCHHSLQGKCVEVAEWTTDSSKAPKCQVQVDYVPPCGHSKQVECWRNQDFLNKAAKFHCKESQTIELPRCGHHCKLSCAMAQSLQSWSGKACDEIGKVIEGIAYGPKDHVCNELVTFVKTCGHKQTLKCGEAFARTMQGYPCNELVETKSRVCGHPCKIACSDFHAIRDVPIPEVVSAYTEGNIPPYNHTLQIVKCKQVVQLTRKCGHFEKVECWRLGKPLRTCKAEIRRVSPLCGHDIYMPCHLKNQEVWSSEDYSSICEENEITNPWSFKTIDFPVEFQKAAVSCKGSIWVMKSCGHKINIPCSDILKTLQNFNKIDKKCSESTLVKLACGHSVSVPCHVAASYQNGSDTICCQQKKRQQCWNFETCRHSVLVNCGYNGLAGCCEKSVWTCAEGHSFDLYQCKEGIPKACPDCCAAALDAKYMTPALPENVIKYINGTKSIKWLKASQNSFFLKNCTRMLQNHKDYLYSIPNKWDRPLSQARFVLCFRVLKGNNVSADWFDPKHFAKVATLGGILVQQLNYDNLTKVSNEHTNSQVTLLIGCALVVQTKMFAGGQLPTKNKKKVRQFQKERIDECYDSLSFTDEKGYQKLVVFEPYTIASLCRVTLSSQDLYHLAEEVHDIPPTNFDVASNKFVLPDDVNNIFFSEAASLNENGASDSDEGDEDDNEMDDKLTNTILAGFQVDPAPFLDGTWFSGAFPESIEKELLQKLQFVNSEAPPFVAVERLKNLAEDTNSPLVELLLAAELYQHDKKRSQQHLNKYLELVTELSGKIHPWALVLCARFDAPNSERLLCAFVEKFPAQEKYLTPEDRANIKDTGGGDDDDDDVGGGADALVQQWEDLKESHGNLHSQAMDDLLKLTGLKKVKEQALKLWKSALLLQQMDDDTRKENMMSLNFCFLGNPGTGKTSVARLFAKILCDSTLRSKNTFKELTAQQAKDGGSDKFRESVKAAMGGVLFIDEAYDLDPVNDLKGKEIVNELLTLCENERDSISVILAGYEDEFQKKFFAYNPGLKSRFREVVFDDFDDDEINEIWTSMRSSKKWDEEDGVSGVVVKRLSKMSGRKGFGNAREVRRRLEMATESAMARQSESGMTLEMKIQIKDVIGDDPRLSSEKLKKVLNEVNSKTGWGRIKKSIDELVNVCGINYELELQGKPPLPIFLNRLFLGNPGTGKTTCAKIYGKLLKELGFLSSGDVVSKTASDFVGSYIGESQKKTNQILESAQGKVLIIDEAYTLDDNHFGKQVLDTLVEKVQGGPSDDIAVLLLGYEEQMLQMLRSQNPGLARRFPKDHALYFDDYSESELLEILKGNLQRQKIEASIEFMQKAISVLRVQRKQSNFGNAGAVDLLVKGALQKASTRMINKNDDIYLEAEDINDPGSSRADKDEDPLSRLDKLFRMEGVKNKLDLLQKSWAVAQREGDKEPDLGHFVFTGSPGTGKTTVARAIADILFSLGLLPSNKFVETSALDLTAGYVGQTKDKVSEALKDAKGGILFIDEAYNLGLGPFGKEACDTIVAAMTSEEYCDVIIVIAGYPQEIDQMLDKNSGLKSRFTHFFEFPDWEAIDCKKFVEYLSKQENYIVKADALAEVETGCKELKQYKGFGNGRDVKKIWEESKKARASRVFAKPELQRIIDPSDVKTAVSSIVTSRKPKYNHSQLPFNLEDDFHNCNTAMDDDTEDLIREKTESREDQRDLKEVSEDIEGKEQAGDDGDDDDENCDVNDGRDPGVTDEKWDELQASKAAEEAYAAEVARQIEAYNEFMEQQRQAEEIARINYELEQKRIQEELEREEQARALKAAQEREEQRRRQEEYERRKREKEIQRLLEEQRRKAAIQEKLKQLSACPAGFDWHKVGDGWRCSAGGHFVTNEELERNFMH